MLTVVCEDSTSPKQHSQHWEGCDESLHCFTCRMASGVVKINPSRLMSGSYVCHTLKNVTHSSFLSLQVHNFCKYNSLTPFYYVSNLRLWAFMSLTSANLLCTSPSFVFPSCRSIHVGLTFNYSFSLVKNVTSQFKEWVCQLLAKCA